MTRGVMKNSLIMIKSLAKKLQNHLQKTGLVLFDLYGIEYEEFLVQERVPEDVKEGHFAILAVKNKEPKRFIVQLCVLQTPAFLGLLKLAEDEYGFEQKGALAVPCRPEELQKILQQQM